MTSSIQELARAFAEEFSARALEGEELRSLPADLAARAKSTGLFRLCLPRDLGGLELDPLTTIEVIEELSRGDGSAGWTVMIGNATAFFAWLDPEVARDLLLDGADFAATGVFTPSGTAEPDGDDAFSVTGRWAFNSGCQHSEWLEVGVAIVDAGVPRMRPDGRPDRRLAFIRREHAEIEDTWHAAGLRGTGSHHLRITNARVPATQLAATFLEPARHPGPLWRLPFFTLATTMISGIPTGIARRALEEFSAVALKQLRSSSPASIATDGYAQVQFAEAEAQLEAARCFVRSAVSDIWQQALGGSAPTIEQRSRLVLAANQAMRASVATVDSVFRLMGARALYIDHPVQRCWRDIHAASQHALFSTNRDQVVARVRLGLEPAPDVF